MTHASKAPLLDEKLLTAINTLHSDWLDTIMRSVTIFGEWTVVLGIGAVVALYLVRRGMHAVALIISGSLIGSLLLNLLLKGLFDRLRPDLWVPLVQETSFSFPSGHATASATLGLAFLFAAWSTRWRIAALWSSVVYIIVIGFSRLYLGVHYPTDVLGGWLLAATVITLMIYCSHAGKNPKLV
ncbi:MAG TPA: phosphatase PAP2 family protein [Candidatus Saccharimonadales bacterium]